MKKDEKYYLFVALQTIIDCMKFRPLLDQPNAEEHNKRLNNVIKFLEELKERCHE